MSDKVTSFLSGHEEKLKLNQFWYSAPTIAAMVAEVEQYATRCAFLSTPSVFFSLNDARLQDNSSLFDFDEMWADHPRFVKYDFHKPLDVPAELQHTFDYVVIDPPFITDDVWQLYASTAQLLLAPQPQQPSQPTPRILLSTIPENLPLLSSLLSVHLCRFRPSIPHLPYQYSFFTSYDSERLSALNAEVDDDEWREEHTARKKTTMESYSSERMIAEEEKQKQHAHNGNSASA